MATLREIVTARNNYKKALEGSKEALAGLFRKFFKDIPLASLIRVYVGEALVDLVVVFTNGVEWDEDHYRLGTEEQREETRLAAGGFIEMLQLDIQGNLDVWWQVYPKSSWSGCVVIRR